MKIILVPTDFSPVSVNAANFAADMAKAIHAEILLFNVYQVPVNYSSEVPLMMVSADELKKASDAQLDELKQKLGMRIAHKINIETQSAQGDMIDELEKMCNQIQPFAVVMGTKGKTGLEQLLFGSTTLSAVRHLVWPVIAVPPGKTYGNGISRIGFACDFKQVKRTVPALLILEIVQALGAELHILNVDYKEKHFTPASLAESFHLHESFRDVNPEYHYLNHPDVEEGINEFAAANDLDLIIAIPKKHQLLEAVFKPSSTKKLVFQSKVPVMCIHD